MFAYYVQQNEQLNLLRHKGDDRKVTAMDGWIIPYPLYNIQYIHLFIFYCAQIKYSSAIGS